MNLIIPSSTILIRVDASMRIGSGHLMRCRNLAHGLRNRGANVVFLCRIHSDAIHASLLDGEFTLLELPSLSKDDFVDRKSFCYEDWLGCSELNDAKDSLRAISLAGINRIDAIIVDHYALSSDWETFIGERFPKVTFLVLDDLADRPHNAHWLIDASRPKFDASTDYHDLLSDRCKLLTGAYFALLSKDYSLMAPIVPAREKLRRILVFFGGVDEMNYTKLTLSALNHHRFIDIDIDVVLGSSAPHLETVSQAVCSIPSMTLHVGLASLSGLMVKADLAIGAAGTTCWERACLGLPSIIIPVAKNQEYGAYELNRLGVAICLQDLDKTGLVHKIRSTLIELLASEKCLRQMSTNSIRLGDGRGVQRAATCLLGPDVPLRLRSALKSDVWLYYWWILDPDVRSQSINTSLIAPGDHQAWFKLSMDSPDVAMFVLVDRGDLPLGQIRFERQRDSNSRIKISFSLDRIVRGLGLGAKLLYLGLESLLSSWGQRLHCYAQVRADNVPSAKVFLRYGFLELSVSDHEMREFELIVSSPD